MTSGWCILKNKHRKLKECWKHWIFPISTSTWEQLPKPLADRSIAWIIGIPIMPFQSIEVKPGSMIYPLNPFGNLHTLALVNLSLKFHSRLFLQSQQTDSHDGYQRVSPSTQQISQVKNWGLHLLYPPVITHSTILLRWFYQQNLHYQRGRAPKKRSSGSTILHWPSHISQRYPHNFPLVSYMFQSYPINSRIIPMTSNINFQELESHIHWLNAKKTTVRVPSSTQGLSASIGKCKPLLLRISVEGCVKQAKHSLHNWQKHCMMNRHHKKHQIFEDPMARSPAPGFARNSCQNSSFEDSMARSPAPGFGWIYSQRSSFEDSMARSPAPGFG